MCDSDKPLDITTMSIVRTLAIPLAVRRRISAADGRDQPLGEDDCD
jgi:hypothetical protein